MVSLTFRARATVLTAIVGAFLSHAAQAADMPFFSPAPEPVNDGMVEWGTGWYLRGDIGAASSSLTSFNGVVLTSDMPNNWTIGLGGGYQYNNWFRTDVTVDYEELFSQKGPNFHFAPCPSSPLTLCSSVSNSKAETIAILSNAYVDLGHWGGFTPYIGAGVGIEYFARADKSHLAQHCWRFGGGLYPGGQGMVAICIRRDGRFRVRSHRSR